MTDKKSRLRKIFGYAVNAGTDFDEEGVVLARGQAEFGRLGLLWRFF